MQEQFGTPGKTITPTAHRAVAEFALRFYRRVYPPDPKGAERLYTTLHRLKARVYTSAIVRRLLSA